MAVAPAELLKEALSLPAEDRFALVDSLLDSLDSEIDSGAEQQWRMEIGQRLQEIDSGTVQTISWEDVQQRLWSRLKS